jgi:hypothetical protein
VYGGKRKEKLGKRLGLGSEEEVLSYLRKKVKFGNMEMWGFLKEIIIEMIEGEGLGLYGDEEEEEEEEEED